MSSLPASLAASLFTASNAGGSWGDLAGELGLFMEAQQDALDATRILNVNLSQEVDQLKAQLLAIPAGRSSTGRRAPSEPKCQRRDLPPTATQPSMGSGKEIHEGGGERARGEVAGFRNSESRALS